MCFLKDIHLFISFVYFQIEQYLSLSKDIKITITPNEMYRIHELILKHKEELVRKLKFHYYQYVRPNDKLPSVKHPFFAGQTENVWAENAFAALILIGCRDVKQLRSTNEIVLFKCEEINYVPSRSHMIVLLTDYTHERAAKKRNVIIIVLIVL